MLKKIGLINTLHLIYFLTLLCVYSEYIVSLFSYNGFENSLNLNNLPISIILIFVSSFSIQKPGLPSYFFLHLTLALVIIPSLVIYCGSNIPIQFVFVSVSAFMLMSMTVNILHVPRFRSSKINSNKLLVFLVILVVAIIGSVLALGGGRFLNFSLAAVYDFRRVAADNLPGIYSYLLPITSKALIPFGATIALLNRRKLILLLLVGLSVLLFGLTSHKSLIFYPFVVIFIYWISRKKHLLNYFLLALIGVVFLSGLDFWMYSQGFTSLSGWFGSLFTRRTLMVPALLNWFYIDFFSDNPYYFWSQSALSFGLVEPPFELSSVNLIGLEYFGREETSANTGWIGSGYANAGFIGVYLYSVLIGIF
ncbi:MAG: hypothetical protein WBG70_19535, partial [Spirulinaceae cyanobacterium]